MRLLLDAHVSGPRVGGALERTSHDVRAVDQEKELERLPDDLLLELAVEDGRILVTQNVKDFYQLARERPLEENHAGLILIPPSVQLHSFGVIISGIQRTLGDLSQDDWIDRVEWMRKEERP